MRLASLSTSVICAASMAGAQVTSISDPDAFHPYSKPPRAAPTSAVSQAGAPPSNGSSTATGQLPDDLQLLVGKHVIVGRLPLCTPNTYAVNLQYAGKKAVVLSYKPNPALAHFHAYSGSLPASGRSMMEDAQKGGIIDLQFDDGKHLDTCGNLLLSQLSSGLSLAPGETIPASAIASTSQSADDRVSAPASAPSNTLAQVRAADRPEICPVVITKASSGVSFGHFLVDALTTSELQRQIDQATHGGQEKHYLDVKMSNASSKPVTAFEWVSAYENKMGDETTSATYVSQNSHPIRPGETYRGYAMDREEASQNGAGRVVLFITRVRFDDDTMWQDDGSHSCSRVTEAK